MDSKHMDNMIMEPHRSRHRPIGVTIIATLVTIGGVLALLGAVLGFFGIGVLGHHITGLVGHIVSGFGYVLGAGALLIALVTLFVAWGLWALKPWAFWVTIVVESIAVIHSVVLFLQSRVSLLSMIGELVIPVIIL